MSRSINPIRGINDVLPDQTAAWQWLERVVGETLNAYGYREIRLPIMERTELFARSIGEATDIVEKEMYTFEDRNGDSLSLRPEATASCVRAGITHGLFHNQQRRLWYSGPMFRYERPQKGRYRQFYQMGAEAFGFEGPDIDAELILVSARIWSRLGLAGLQLELNSLGTAESRAGYRELLVEYFRDRQAELDDDSLRRLGQNPLRILDSKNPAMAGVIADAPVITEHLDTESAEHFAALKDVLDGAGVGYVLNPRLVRGLDYYSRTVFEWTTDRLGAQSAVCSGGRYDGLVEQLGGRYTPAIGWAMGVERLVDLLTSEDLVPSESPPHVYLVPLGRPAEGRAQVLAESLRDRLPDLRLRLHCGGGGMKARMKRADRSGAAYAMILGDDELADQSVVMKSLRTSEQQRTVPWDGLAELLAPLCGDVAADRKN
jgi:histidyl-tRNA synthetase